MKETGIARRSLVILVLNGNEWYYTHGQEIPQIKRSLDLPSYSDHKNFQGCESAHSGNFTVEDPGYFMLNMLKALDILCWRALI